MEIFLKRKFVLKLLSELFDVAKSRNSRINLADKNSIIK